MVVGEAVRRVSPESAEFLIEITANSATVTQALRDHNAKRQQITQAVGPLGVQPSDVQTISLNAYNLYSPMMPALPGYGGMAQLGSPNMSAFGGAIGSSYGAGMGAQSGLQPGALNLQTDVQFGSYQVRSLVRVTAREPGRVGEIVDAATRAGAVVAGSFSFRAADEPGARRAALEAAGKDARAKAETLAQATGKQLGDAVAVTEDIVIANGAFAALRSAIPAFGASSAPAVIGELEYYARVSASFKLQ
jgi:uncharacterized protein YggE